MRDHHHHHHPIPKTHLFTHVTALGGASEPCGSESHLGKFVSQDEAVLCVCPLTRTLGTPSPGTEKQEAAQASHD